MTTPSALKSFRARIVPIVKNALKKRCHFAPRFKKVEVDVRAPKKDVDPKIYCLVTFKTPIMFRGRKQPQLMAVLQRHPTEYDNLALDSETVEAAVQFFDVNIARALGVELPKEKPKKPTKKMREPKAPPGYRKTAAGIMVPVEMKPSEIKAAAEKAASESP